MNRRAYRRRRPGSVVTLPALVLLWCLALPAKGVEVLQPGPAQPGRYVLRNRLVEVTVDPADGGGCRIASPSGKPSARGPGAILARDAASGGQTCRYQVARQVADASVGVLTLRWEDGNGLQVEKVVSLLAGQQLVHVSYRIANGSAASAGILSSFFWPAPPGGGAEVVLRREGDLVRIAAGDIPASGSGWFERVRWFSVSGPDETGVAAIAGAGMLSGLELRGDESGGRIELRGATTLVPGGSEVSTALVLAPYVRLPDITNATARVLCAVKAGWIEEEGHFAVRLVPLVQPGEGSVGLRISSGPTVRREVHKDAGGWDVGVARTFRFDWVPLVRGLYRVELVLPSGGNPLTLGSCQVTEGDLRFAPDVPLPIERVTFREAGAAPPAEEAARSGQLRFVGAQGEPIQRLRADVGLGESETLIAAVAEGGPDPGQWQVTLSGFSTRRRVQRLPEGTVRLLRPLGPPPASPAQARGPVAPAPASESPSAGVALLWIAAPVVEPASYYGRLEFAGPGGRSALPVEVAVWPVERPEQGPAALYVAGPGRDLFAGPSPSDRARAALNVRNVSVNARSLLRPDLVRVQVGPGGSRPLGEWLARGARPTGPQSLPTIDFSALNAAVEAALLSGLTDLLAQGPLAVGALVPAGCPAARRMELTEWYWRELAAHLRSRGMRTLRFAAPRPLRPAALDAEWADAAALLARAGWSPCGPYTPDAVTGETAGRLASLSDAVIVEATEPARLPSVRRLLPSRPALGAWLPDLADDATYPEARERIVALTDAGADLIIVGGRGGTVRLDTLAWQAVRDAVDEANYRRPAGEAMNGLAATKRQALEQFVAAARAGRLDPPDLYWDDLPLVTGGRPGAVIAVDPAVPTQRVQAELLNAFVKARYAVALPVVQLDGLSPAQQGTLVLVCGSPTTSTLLADLLSDRPELHWRLERSGWLFAEVERDGFRYLALLTADESDRGRPLVSFKMLLRRDGVRVVE